MLNIGMIIDTIELNDIKIKKLRMLQLSIEQARDFLQECPAEKQGMEDILTESTCVGMTVTGDNAISKLTNLIDAKRTSKGKDGEVVYLDGVIMASPDREAEAMAILF